MTLQLRLEERIQLLCSCCEYAYENENENEICRLKRIGAPRRVRRDVK